MIASLVLRRDDIRQRTLLNMIGWAGPDNHGAAQTDVPIVKNDRLPWRHCPLRDGKTHMDQAIVNLRDRTFLVGLAVADFRPAAEWQGVGK